MILCELIEKFQACNACISITGLCDEYRDGLDMLVEEPWYEDARDQIVKKISIIGYDEYSFELIIDI